ncbi:MAG TPA: MFS transporter [Solirubrobacterales bacterium]|nr:MFS transporter [Solirubrobacterales bacterium]
MAARIRRRPRPAVAAFAGIFAVTLLALLSVGAVIPVLPRYVKGPLGEGDLAVGFVVGAFAFTGLAARPLAGHLADLRGRRLAVLLGSLTAGLAGVLYFVPGGLASLVASRFALGAGEGTVFTAGAAWVVDLAPPQRRGRIVGLYGLAVWTGLSLGPPIGELLLHAGGYDLVWAFATAAPLVGALIALRLPDPFRPGRRDEPRALIARESLRPGLALSLGVVGYAAMAAFIILHLDEQGPGHGAAAFTVFAASVVVTRLAAGNLPDRIGPVRCALGAAVVEAIGLMLIALAPGLPLTLVGAVAMGAAFSTLYPSLLLVVVDRVPETRRGSAVGTFTAFFDIGVGLGAPLTGAAVALGGVYAAAFWLAAACAAVSAVTIATRLRTASAGPALAPAGSAPAPRD